MKIKNLIALFLCLSLLLCGCGASEEPERGTITPAETEAQTKAEEKVSLGVMEGGTYENTYIGYGCTLGEGWVYKTAEELQDISGMTQEILDGTDIGDQVDAYSQITDMFAENLDLLMNINILYSRLTPQQRLVQFALTEEQMVDATLEQKDLLVTSYSQAGIEVSTLEKVTVTFLGQERTAIHTEATIDGVNYYILQLFEMDLGGSYYVTLTLSSFVEDNTVSMLDLFHPL